MKMQKLINYNTLIITLKSSKSNMNKNAGAIAGALFVVFFVILIQFSISLKMIWIAFYKM